MPLAFALLAHSSLPFALYASHLEGATAQDLAKKYRLSPEWMEERIEAIRLTLTMQVRVDINRHAETFRAAESR